MSARDKDIREQARQWLAYAAEDLTFARHGLKLGSDCPFRLVAYHAQQCAEKALKAFLVFHRDDSLPIIYPRCWNDAKSTRGGSIGLKGQTS